MARPCKKACAKQWNRIYHGEKWQKIEANLFGWLVLKAETHKRKKMYGFNALSESYGKSRPNQYGIPLKSDRGRKNMDFINTVL